MLIALYEDCTDSNPTVRDVTWSELVEALTDVRLGEKDGPAWSPAEIDGKRANANVRAITVAVLDLDHIQPEVLERVQERLEWEELGYVLHSTHSHKEKDWNLRLVIPLTRPVLPSEWPAVRAGIMAMLEDIPADPSTKDLARLYYFPRHAEGAPTFFDVVEGKLLDVDTLPTPCITPAKDPGANVAQSPVQETNPVHEWKHHPPMPGQSYNLDEARSRLRSIRKAGTKELIAKILHGEPLAKEGERDNTVNRAAAVLAHSLSDMPVAAALEILRPSIILMPGSEGVEYWMDKARYSYERAAARKLEKDAKDKALTDAIALPKKASPDLDIDGDWASELITREVDGVTKLAQTSNNARRILTYSPEWRGVLRFNEVTKDIEVHGGPLDCTPRPEVLDVHIAEWLARSVYALSLEPSRIRTHILAASLANAYDPIVNYLKGVVWDGTPRLNGMLKTYFGADTQIGAMDITEYTEKVGARTLMIAAVARAMNPGCKADDVAILEGPQGLFKSSALRVLGGEWFTDASLTLGDKDTQMLISTSWIVELAELASFKKSEGEARKAFFSRPSDKYRPPYGARTIEVPRRCVFVGTTNDDDYLSDLTGNRRYRPVRCTMIDLEGLKRDRDQLWAEAVARYESGEKWWLDTEDFPTAEAVALERVPEGAKVDMIRAWFLALAPGSRPSYVRTHEIARDVFSLTSAQINRAIEIEIGQALTRLGFKRKRMRVGGALTWVSVPPANLVELPQYRPGARETLEGIANA